MGSRKTSLHWQSGERGGISTLGDICHPTEGRLLSHTEIADKFKVQCTFLEAISIRLQIPLYWRDALSRDWKPPPLSLPDPDISVSFREGFPKALVFLSAKEMYNNLLHSDYQINAAYRRRSAGEDGISVDNTQEWNDISWFHDIFSISMPHAQGDRVPRLYSKLGSPGVEYLQRSILYTSHSVCYFRILHAQSFQPQTPKPWNKVIMLQQQLFTVVSTLWHWVLFFRQLVQSCPSWSIQIVIYNSNKYY